MFCVKDKNILKTEKELFRIFVQNLDFIIQILDINIINTLK